MRLFYKENFEQELVLDETDSKHCIRVLRKKEGDEIAVTDGIGNLFTCVIREAHQKKTKLEIIETRREFEKPKRRITIAIAPTKNMDRIEYFVEKAVEIGVSEICFIQTKNSERKNIKLDRVRRIAISAMKQSLKAYLPVLGELRPVNQFLADCSVNQKFIAHLSDISTELQKNEIENDVCILVGPEGDFIQQELDLASEKGFKQVSMGYSRLRTETAGLVSVTLLNLI